MGTLVDTNVLIDVFHRGSPFEDWALSRLVDARRHGQLVINPLIYAEMAAGFSSTALLDSALSQAEFCREDLPWEAAFAAGHAYVQYRKAGGEKRSPLPDFYIGAHASSKGYHLLTRDSTRYRTYFPILSLITPETHP